MDEVVTIFNATAAAALAVALGWAVLSHRVRDGVVIKLGLICMALGFAIERIAYRPLRKAPRLAPLITAIGVSIRPGRMILARMPKRAFWMAICWR